MSNRGRYGKYGEIKRFDRLRRGRIRQGPFLSDLMRSQAPPRRKAQRPSGQSVFVTRPAAPGDLGFVLRLSREAFGRYGPYEETLRQWFQEDGPETFLALQGAHPTGFAMLEQVHEAGPTTHLAEILAIAVTVQNRRRGAGTLLMSHLLKTARSQGMDLLVLHTALDNLPAQRLFEKHGFISVKVKKAFYPAGQDAVMMVKTLSDRSNVP